MYLHHNLINCCFSLIVNHSCKSGSHQPIILFFGIQLTDRQTDTVKTHLLPTQLAEVTTKKITKSDVSANHPVEGQIMLNYS